MKATILLLISIFIISCTGDESCVDSGCDSGKHCVEDTGKCETNCTSEYCATIGEACNAETGLCEEDCSVSGCKEGFECNTETKACRLIPCSTTGCDAKFYCDEETQICQPDKSCRTVGCKGELMCNHYNGKCEEANEYPAGPYEKENGKVIENIKWTDTEGNEISLKMLHNQYLKTGYPRAILLVASAGWCSPCRAETPEMEIYYNEMKLANGREKLYVLQTIINNNSNGVPASNNFVKGWINQYGLTYKVVNDPKALIDKYNFEGGIPFNIVINPKNMKIVARRNGIEQDPDTYKVYLNAVKSVVDPLYNQNGPCAKMNCTENQFCQAMSNNGKSCVDGKCETGFMCNDKNKCVADPKQEEVVKCYDRAN